MAFDTFCTKAVAWNHPQKRCKLPLIFAAIGQAVRRYKALDLGSLNMQFQKDGPKDKKLQLFKFLQENLEKICAKICNFSKIGAKIGK